MLSIDPVKDAKDAGDYYLGKNKGSYYAKGGEGENWYGKGASKLGLEGRVDKEVFVKLLKGKRKNHAPGIDMTFNAPKSVSIMAEVFGDKRIYEAHTKAVEVALDYVEENLVRYRKLINKRNTYQKGDNITAALFMEHTSRNLDPHLHTHCVLANIVHTEEERAAYFKEIYDNKMFLGQLYRFELAYNIHQLGYELIKSRECHFELAQIPQGLIQLFSTRSQEIKEAASKYEKVTAALKSMLAIVTRKRKKEVDP